MDAEKIKKILNMTVWEAIKQGLINIDLGIYIGTNPQIHTGTLDTTCDQTKLSQK